MNIGVKVFGVIAVVLVAMTASAYALPTLAAPDIDQDRLRDQQRTCDGSGDQIRNRDQNSTCLRLGACYSVQVEGQYSTGNGFGAETRSA
jgi:hypothetical protein